MSRIPALPPKHSPSVSTFCTGPSHCRDNIPGEGSLEEGFVLVPGCGGSQSTRVGKAWQLEGTWVLAVVAHRELFAWHRRERVPL